MNLKSEKFLTFEIGGSNCLQVFVNLFFLIASLTPSTVSTTKFDFFKKNICINYRRNAKALV